MTETETSYRGRVLRVLLYIEEHLDEELSRDKLASVACFSPYHFHRLFTAFAGEPLQKYIRRLRLERALHQLAYSEESVLNVALNARFETHEAFTRAFRRAFEMSPTELRQRASQRDPFLNLQPQNSLKLKPLGDIQMDIDVRIEKLEPKAIAFLRHVGPYTGIGNAFQQLLGWAGPNGCLTPSSEVLGIYYDNPDVTAPEKLRADAAVTVQGGVSMQGDVQLGEIAGGDCAIATYRGGYAGLPDCYRWLYGVWLPQSGREPADRPCYERYVNSPMDTPEADLVTEIHMPLK